MHVKISLKYYRNFLLLVLILMGKLSLVLFTQYSYYLITIWLFYLSSLEHKMKFTKWKLCITMRYHRRGRMAAIAVTVLWIALFKTYKVKFKQHHTQCPWMCPRSVLVVSSYHRSSCNGNHYGDCVVTLMLSTWSYLPNPNTNSNVLGCHVAMNVPAYYISSHEVSQVVAAIAVTRSVNSVIIFTQSTVRTPVCLDAARP